MTDLPSDPSSTHVAETEETCFGHPDTPTRLHCTRCDKPICGRCAVPASVGQHCVWCVAEARKKAPKVRSALQANSPAVLVIIVLNVMIWIGQFFVPQLTQMFASHSPSIAQGQWWRLLTPMFLHAPFTGSIFSLMHIGFNMYILRVFGPNVEESFKTSRFVPMYLAAGFAGSAASYAFGSCFGLGVGASGAIFGVVGILLAYMYNRRTSTFVADAMRNLLFFVGLNLFIGFTIPIIDNAAHIGGLVAGLVLGYGMDPGAGRAPSLPRQIITLVLVVGATLLLVMWKTANFAC